MKKGTIGSLPIAAVGVLASMASALPLSVSVFANQGGLDPREITQGNEGRASVRQDVDDIGPYATQLAMVGELSELNTQEQSAPISGSFLILLGAAFLALAGWQHWSHGKGPIPRKSIVPDY